MPSRTPLVLAYACRWVLAALPAWGAPLRCGPPGPLVLGLSVTCSVLGLRPLLCVIRAGAGSVVFGVPSESPGVAVWDCTELRGRGSGV